MHEFAYLFLLRANPSLGTLRCRWRLCSRVQVLRKLPSLTFHSETLHQSHSRDQRLGLLGPKVLQRRQLQCADGSPAWFAPHCTHTVSSSALVFPWQSLTCLVPFIHSTVNCQSQCVGGGPSTKEPSPVFISSVIQKVSRSRLLKCLSVSIHHDSSWPSLSQRFAVLLSRAPIQSSICISICISIFIFRAQLPGWKMFLNSWNQQETPAMAPREMTDPGVAALLAYMNVTSRAHLPPWIPSTHRGLRKASVLGLSLGIPLHTLACAAMNL